MADQAFFVEAPDRGSRLDIYLAKILSERFSRSQIQKLIKQGGIHVDGKKVMSHYKVKEGDKIEVQPTHQEPEGTRAEAIPLEILHEDEELVFVNKPAGMVVHPAAGNQEHTLVNALLYHVKGLSSGGGSERPGIVHRLDKETSGIMVIAKNDQAHAFIAKQFKDRTIERYYRVIVRGVVQHEEGVIEEPVGRAFLNRKKIMIRPSGGKEAETYFRVIERFKKGTLLEVQPRTGRTHQIRVHMKYMDHPVLGDSLYGIRHPGISRQSVHAFALGVIHPKSRERLYLECPIPKDMRTLLDYLAKE